MNDLAEFIKETAEAHARMAKVGMVAGEEHAKRYIRAITVAYARAIQDQEFKCPSYLMAAIESARQYAGETSANAYAEAMIRSDKEVPEWERKSIRGEREE